MLRVNPNAPATLTDVEDPHRIRCILVFSVAPSTHRDHATVHGDGFKLLHVSSPRVPLTLTTKIELIWSVISLTSVRVPAMRNSPRGARTRGGVQLSNWTGRYKGNASPTLSALQRLPPQLSSRSLDSGLARRKEHEAVGPPRCLCDVQDVPLAISVWSVRFTSMCGCARLVSGRVHDHIGVLHAHVGLSIETRGQWAWRAGCFQWRSNIAALFFEDQLSTCTSSRPPPASNCANFRLRCDTIDDSGGFNTTT